MTVPLRNLGPILVAALACVGAPSVRAQTRGTFVPALAISTVHDDTRELVDVAE